MPHIRFSGLEQNQVQTISTQLVDKLAPLADCPRDHFTLELLPTRFIFDGKLDANGYPMIDVLWFDRGQTVQDEMASTITAAVRNCMMDKNLDICVRFYALNPKTYYENGEHF